MVSLNLSYKHVKVCPSFDSNEGSQMLSNMKSDSEYNSKIFLEVLAIEITIFKPTLVHRRNGESGVRTRDKHDSFRHAFDARDLNPAHEKISFA
jgi:hypothetical protein